jgi:hypothetical protein
VPFTSKLNTPGKISDVRTAGREKKKNKAWNSVGIMFKNPVSCIISKLGYLI